MAFLKNMGKNLEPKTLQNKLIIIITLVILVLLSLTGALFMTLTSSILKEQVGKRAVNISKAIAEMSEIRDLIIARDPDKKLPVIAERVREKVDAKFVVIGDKNGIRFAHPNPAKIGHNMIDDDGDDNWPVLKEGRSYISHEKGSLGVSIRGKSPIFDDQGRVAGIVSVGFLMENVKSVIAEYLMIIKIFIVLAIFVGVLSAIYIARGVKWAIFGLEPVEIANLLQQKNAILEAIRAGVLAIDDKCKVSMINQHAVDALGLSSPQAALGKHVMKVMPQSGMCHVLETGKAERDVEIILNNTAFVVNMSPIVHKNSVIGVVGSFRSKDELYRMTKELSRVREYSEMLRAQTHEYSNKLHTIAGLLQIEKHSEALDMIISAATDYQDFVKLMTSTIKDPVLSAIIIGKYNYAKEHDIEFIIDPDSSMKDIPAHINRENLVTILGNLLNNSFDALTDSEVKVVKLSMTDLSGDLIFEVEDSGGGISGEVAGTLFNKGVSTKGEGNRGLGLFMVNNIIKEMNGYIETGKSELGGACFTVAIPKGGE